MISKTRGFFCLMLCCSLYVIWNNESIQELYTGAELFKGIPSYPNQNDSQSSSTSESPTTTTTPSGWTTWEREQHRRKEVLRKGCQNLDLSKKDVSLDLLLKSPSDVKRISKYLLVDDKRKAIYCYIPKIACTNWKKLWMVLTGLTAERNLSSIPLNLPHLVSRKMNLGLTLQPSHLKDKLKDYRKFIVVRHPMERLLSAYRDKVGGEGFHHEHFQKKVLPYVKKHRRSNATLSDIMWSEFVDYLTLGNGTDDHWDSYMSLCYPCAINYDIIAKFETLQEDSDRFLRLIGAPDDLHFPNTSRTSRRVDDVLRDYYLWERYKKQLSIDQLTALQDKRNVDLKLFDYPWV